jgi:hypothetical protein
MPCILLFFFGCHESVGNGWKTKPSFKGGNKSLSKLVLMRVSLLKLLFYFTFLIITEGY